MTASHASATAPRGKSAAVPLLALLLIAACEPSDDVNDDVAADAAPAAEPATALASGPAELTPEALEAGRLDTTWRRYAAEGRRAARARRGARASAPDTDATQDTPAAPDPAARADTAPRAAADTATGETGTREPLTWDDISPETVNAPVRGLPIHGDVAGPDVARVQILLDLNRFSPGVIDGRWGKNTEKAVYWFQEAHGIEATGRVDRPTLDALERGADGDPVVTRQISQEDLAAETRSLPEDVYERAAQPCLCYESRREQLAEVFHTTPELLEQLNPDVDLGAVGAADALSTPAVDPFRVEALPEGKHTGGQGVARIVISDGGHYLHALDEQDDVLYHFPSTLGADYAPSPEGEFSVESITFGPTWHYQPDLLSRVDPSREDAVLPAGPNNAVGVVWMQLSRPHYGIHGTSAPETIGYATSHGCVRLPNWDAAFLADRLPPGTPVEFTGVTGRD